MSECACDTLEVNGVRYVREAAKPGKRAVVVVDRGWIFAGDLTEENGRIRLTRALHVFGWSGIGFSRMIAEPKGGKVDLRKVADVDVPKEAEIFRVPVSDDWGL